MTSVYDELNIRSVDLPGTGRMRSVNVGNTDVDSFAVDSHCGRTTMWAGICSVLAAVLETTYSMFLPKGYPGSVSPDYLKFQTMDSIQARR